jgi:UDP:flavonoid glycosyltransferase YjiC (YdhE family)
MRTVLLTWELGGGFGHVVRLRRLATRLARRGFRMVAAVNNIQVASSLAAEGVEIFQAPLWPVVFQSIAQRAAHSSATLGDMLRDGGLGDEQDVRMLIGTWDRLLALIGPDLVIADYAPAASLAARGRIPLALVGTGFTLPPAEMDRFPILHDLSPPVWPEQELVDVINSALRSLHREPLERLPQLFAGDVRWVQTFPLLDPYNLWRERPAEGPMLDQFPEPRRSDAGEILVYISMWPATRTRILEPLAAVAKHVRVYAPGLPSGELQRLASFGMRVETGPFRLADELASARLIVHLGGAGVSCEALIAGVPQLVLSIDIEKELTGAAIERAGIGKLLRIHDPAVSLSTDTMESLLSGGGIANQAQEVGSSHRQMFQNADPLSDFETNCVDLMM